MDRIITPGVRVALAAWLLTGPIGLGVWLVTWGTAEYVLVRVRALRLAKLSGAAREVEIRRRREEG